MGSPIELGVGYLIAQEWQAWHIGDCIGSGLMPQALRLERLNLHQGIGA